MTAYRLLLACLLILSLIPGTLLICEIWDTEPDGYSVAIAKLPTWDFTNLWAGGVLARAGKLSVLFDPAAYSQWLRGVYMPRLDDHEWSYPPSLLLLAVPMSLLPLIPSYLVWTVGTFGLLWLAMRQGGLPPAVCAVAIASPAVLNNIAFGHNGAFTGALMVGSLLLLDRRPILSGVLMGLLTIKPHLGVLLPVCVIASRNWRALAAAIATALALAAITTLAFGSEVWTLFINKTQPKMRSLLEAPWQIGFGFQMNSVTLFHVMRAAGASVIAAYGAQAVAAVAAAILTWRAWRVPGADPRAKAALTIILTYLTTPYGYSYDMVAFSVAIAMLIALNGWRVSPFEALAWIWPGFTHYVTQFYFPLSPLIVAGAAWIAWRRLRAPASFKPAVAV